jgi:hypothetical protein
VRRRLALALALGLAIVAGCADPEPERTPEPSYGRVKYPPPPAPRVEGRAGTSVGLDASAGPHAPSRSSTRIKQELLSKYGARLTSLQRSALQTSHVSDYESGEKMCLGWIEENRRFETER